MEKYIIAFVSLVPSVLVVVWVPLWAFVFWLSACSFCSRFAVVLRVEGVPSSDLRLFPSPSSWWRGSSPLWPFRRLFFLRWSRVRLRLLFRSCLVSLLLCLCLAVVLSLCGVSSLPLGFVFLSLFWGCFGLCGVWAASLPLF